VLSLKEFVCRCEEIYSFANSPYTRGTVHIPSTGQKKETFFFAICKPNQEEFTKLYQNTEEVSDKQMLTFFEYCFRQDSNSGRTAQLRTAQEEKCRKANTKCHNGGQSSRQGEAKGAITSVDNFEAIGLCNHGGGWVEVAVVLVDGVFLLHHCREGIHPLDCWNFHSTTVGIQSKVTGSAISALSTASGSNT